MEMQDSFGLECGVQHRFGVNPQKLAEDAKRLAQSSLRDLRCLLCGRFGLGSWIGNMPSKLLSGIVPFLLLNFSAGLDGNETADLTHTDSQSALIIVVGAAGEEQYGEQFKSWAEGWNVAAERGGVTAVTIGLTEDSPIADKEHLRKAISEQEEVSANDLWLVFLGHGTYNGREAKFNLRGPDLSPAELKSWLEPLQRSIAILDCTSSSAPFINELAGKNRVVISATKSGYEMNFARFGRFLVQAINEASADLDKDGQTSLLEAFLKASRDVTEFYELDGRLTSEHALIEDTGDGRGTPAEWYRGVRVVKESQEGAKPDGRRAHQLHLIRSEFEKNIPPAIRVDRDALEMEVFALRDKKSSFSTEEYYGLLEELLVNLAELYEKLGENPVHQEDPVHEERPEPKEEDEVEEESEDLN